MKKSVEQQILEWLQHNPGIHHGGMIQRLYFTTRNGGTSTGDTIKRRLNDLVEEGLIFVSYNERYEAMFSANQEKIPAKKTFYIRNPDTKELVAVH